MLKYIHQFVQTFLREASKTRPKSRKSSRSSVDLTKDKSTMKPEILAIDFNNEGQEAERSKEILELKRTYSLLMKKFVNPKLDLMTDTKTSSDTGILSLKGKQELIKSAINKIFNESTGQQKQLEGISKDSYEANVKPENEELSVGWSGQRTSKLAANPMVETSSQSKNIASALFSFPETQEEPSRNNARKTETFLKHQFEVTDLKEQKIESKQNITTTSNALVGSDLRSSASSSQIKPEQVSSSGNTDTNLNSGSFKETIMEDKICSKNIDKCFPSKDNLKENLQPPLNEELNSNSEINKESSNSSREMKYVTQCNKQKNINVIGSITKVDKSKIIKYDSHPIKEKNHDRPTNKVFKSTKVDKSKIVKSDSDSLKDKNNDTMKIVKSITSGQNKVAQTKINKPQKTGTNLKISVDKPNKLGSGVSKKKETPNEKNYPRKNDQSAILPLNPEGMLLDSLPNSIKLPPTTEKTAQLTGETVNTHSDKGELIMLKSNTREEMNKEAATTAGENLSKLNFETLEKEQNQTCLNKLKVKDGELKEKWAKQDQAAKNVDKITNETVDENLEPTTNTYWNLLSNKLLKTSNDAQKFINNFEISSWKRKIIGSTDSSTKDFIVENNICDKQSTLEQTSESSKQENQENQNVLNSSNVKAKCGFKSDLKGTDNVKSQTFQTESTAHVSESQPTKLKIENQYSIKKHSKTSKNVDSLESQLKYVQTSKSKDFNSAKETLNTTMPACDAKHNNITTKSSNDLSNNITNIHKSSESQSDSTISPRKADKNTTGNKENYLKNDLGNKPEIVKIKSTACILSENHKVEPHKREISNIDEVKNIIPGGDNKIKKLLKRFKKLESNKSKQNVVTAQRICNKILNDGRFKKMPLYKLKATKDKTHILRARKAMRTKSDHLAINKPLSSHQRESCVRHVPTKGKLQSNMSQSKRVKINRVDSNIFSNVNRNTIKHECMKYIEPNTLKFMAGHHFNETNQDTIQHSSNMTTEFDLIKGRKLHSRREVCKPAKLQMYGAKRSIYTYSNPKATLLLDTSILYIKENITEPNLSSNSLMKVSRLTQTNSRLLKTPVRNLHKTSFRGKVKQLPRKKKSTVIKGSSKTKPVIADTVTSCPTDESTANISKSMDNKLRGDPTLTTVNNLDKICPSLSSQDKLTKEKSLNDVENQIQNSDKNNCLQQDTNNCSLFSSSVKTKTGENADVLYNKSERKGHPHVIPNSKEDKLLHSDSTSTSTPQQSDTIKSSEKGLNLGFQNVQPSQGNEVRLDSPKWRSKEDRLEKWKAEVECNKAEVNAENADKKTNEEYENRSSNVQTEGIRKDENNITFEKDENKKELLGNQATKNKILKNINISNENVEKKYVQKEETNSTVCIHVGNNTTKGENEDNKLHEGSVKTLKPLTNKNNTIQNRNNKVKSVQNKLNNEVGENNKRDTSTPKVKEFESMLRVLESKLKALELKSVEENKTENVSKSIAQKDTGCVTVSLEGNHIKMDETEIGIKAEGTKLAGTNRAPQNKNKITNLTLSVKNDGSHSKKDQNDRMKENLSQKVRNLEFKLKSLEAKLQDLKEKPSNIINKTELHKSSSLCRTSEESFSPKVIQNQTKNYEGTNNFHSENGGKLGNSNNPNRNNVQDEKEGKVGTKTVVDAKPELYSKHYLTSNKNNFEKKHEKSSNKNVVNNIRQFNNKSPSLPLQSTSSMNELNLKNSNVASVKNISGKFKQKLQPQNMKLSENNDSRKYLTYTKNKVDKQKIKNVHEKLNFTPNTTALHDNTTSTKKTKWSESSSSIPLIKNSSREAGRETKTSTDRSKNINKDTKKQNITIPTKKGIKKCPTLKVDKNMSLKRNSDHQSTLHEGLLRVKSSSWLKSLGSTQGDTAMQAKISSVAQTKLPLCENNLKSPVFPKKLFKALNKLKKTPEKQNHNNSKVGWRGNNSSSGLLNFLPVKDEIDSTSKSSSKREKTEKTFNTFDYYRPKRRAYDVKHPIEKEKYGIELLKNNEIILDKFYPKHLSQNATLQSLERNRGRKELVKFHKDSDKHLNTLITQKSRTAVKSIQK